MELLDYSFVTNRLYMNYQYKDGSILGIPEGEKGVKYDLNEGRLELHEQWLTGEIAETKKMLNIFNRDYKFTKKLEKLELYMKRLNNVKKKMQ